MQVVLDVRHLVAEVFDDFFFSHCLEILLTPRTPYGSGQGSQMVLNDSRRRDTPTPRVVYDGGT